MINPYQLYLQHLRKIPTLAADEEKSLWKRVRQGDKRAKKKIIIAYLKLVLPIAKKYERSGMDMLDLIEEGNIGLIHAVDKFDIRKKVKFTTYSAYWIEQTIRRAVDEQKRTIRIPSHLWAKMKKWFQFWGRLQLQYGREPTMKEMAKKMKMNSRELKKMLDIIEVSRTHTSFDAFIDENEKVHVGDLISDQSDEMGKFIDYMRVSNHLDKAMEVLSEREKEIVRWRFGLVGRKAHTLDHLAKKMNLSKERVRQLLERSCRYIKAAIDRMKYK